MQFIQGVIPQISNLSADVWISEEHKRELQITENPIEFGAPITDHAYILPQELVVEFGVTNTPLHFNDTLGFDGQSRIDSAREILFKKQTDREFLTAETITGGLYQNLLIKTISWRTDSNNPNSITFALTLKEVLVTATETTTYSPSSEEKRVQDQTSKTVKTGEKSATKLDSKDKTVTVQDKTKAQAAQKQAYEIKTSKVNR